MDGSDMFQDEPDCPSVTSGRPALSIRYVESPDELPASDHAICVAFGKADGWAQIGKLRMIRVNAAGLSDHLAVWRLKIAVESAKSVARKEGIEMIYVCKTQVDH